MKRRPHDDEDFNPYDDGREVEADDDDELDPDDELDTPDESDLCEHGNHPRLCEWCDDELLAAELGEVAADPDGDDAA